MRSIRLLLLSLTFTLALLMLAAASADGVHAGEDPAPPASLPTFTTVPLHPMRGEPFTLLAIVPQCPPCLTSVRWEVPEPLRVRLAIRAFACATFAPCAPDTVRIPMPGMSGGSGPVSIQVRSVIAFGDSAGRDSAVVDTTLLHTVITRPGDYIQPIPLHARVWIDGELACDSCPPPTACADRPIRVRLAGEFPTGCGHVAKVELIPSMVAVIGPPTVRVLLDSDQCRSEVCTLMPTPWLVDTLIPGLPAGSYRLPVEVGQVSCSDSILPGRLSRASLAFQTAVGCTLVLPPPIPLTATVSIGGQPAGGTPPPSVCADRPIPIRIAGAFPSSCGRVRKVEFLPSALAVIGPPTVRVLLDTQDCLDVACLEVITPWQVDTVLPGLPLGRYTLPVEIAQVSCSDEILPGRIARQALPFSTSDACTTATPRCFWPDWRPQAHPFQCALSIPPGGEDTLTFGVRSFVALAGLQGRIVTGPLVVKDIRPIGFARTMNLQWVRTENGARFVLFSTDGSVIPRYFDPLIDPTDPWPHLLRITVGMPQDARGNAFRVDADSLLGADPQAGAVPECIPITASALPGGLLVCRQSGCDVDGDGRADVRDLVTMVHCILGHGSCPDTTAGRYDCDGDGSATLSDILCCARALLRGAPPDTTPPVKEPGVAVRFGEPQRGGGGVRVPITLSGADRIGALRLVLDYPADRYTVDGLTSTAGSGWLALHEVRDGQVVVGLVALTPPGSGAEVPLTLSLALQSGQTDGGDVTVAAADLSAPDGAALATDLPGVAVTIAAPRELSLAVGPNPVASGGATVRFGLPRAANVDVGVYDIAGRRVATLASGALPAGTHARTWDAADARDGVYFVRLRADGVELAHKAVLRRGR